MAIAGMLAPTLALAAVPPLPRKAADLESAHGAEAVKIRDDVIAAAPPLSAAVDRDGYAKAVITEFGKLLSSENPDARLNTAIMIQQLGTLFTDRALMDMLKNQDAAVRYWGAKGLATIAPSIKLVGATTVTGALGGAARVEKSGVVLSELFRSLSAYDSLDPVIDALGAIAANMRTTAPERSMLDGVTTGLAVADRLLKSATPAQKTAAAKAAAEITSFATQHLSALDKLQRAAGGGTVPQPLVDATIKTVETAFALFTTASGKTFRLPPNSTLDDLVLTVTGTVRTAAGGPGELQKAMPGLPVPPAITPPAAPATNTATRPGT